jgi:hypothetical protein
MIPIFYFFKNALNDVCCPFQSIVTIVCCNEKLNCKNNAITVGNCGQSTVNFSQFLSCLGMTVQETTTLTATFTETTTLSAGFTTMTVLGCLPARFPYEYCPAGEIIDSETQIEN